MTTNDRPKALSLVLHFLRSHWMALIGGVLAMIAAYYAIGFYLTGQISAHYAEHDCISVQRYTQPLKSLYPKAIAPFYTPAKTQANECSAYINAVQKNELEEWQDAYTAYQYYLEAYPDGIFAAEAQEGAAQALYSWGQVLQENKEYDKTVEKLLTLMDDFADLSLVTNAKDMLPEVYLEWADTLQQENDFTAAALKYQKAVEIDPNPSSVYGPTAQVQAALPKFQRSWADFLAGQGKFEDAIDHYNLSISISKPEDVPAAQDALVQGYLKWAEALRAEDDFQIAFDKLEDAQQAASTETAKAWVESAHSTTLKAFSESSGDQARQIMADTAKAICMQEQPAETLIIGTDADQARVYLYGLENVTLSNQVRAQTPATMHYVACVTKDVRIIDVCTYHYWTDYYRGSDVRYYLQLQRHYWVVKLRDTKNGKVYKVKEIAGSDPGGCPYSAGFSRDEYSRTLSSGEPHLADLDAWLLTLVK